MAEQKMGPKEAQVRALREARLREARDGRKIGREPSTSELRGKIAKIKGGGKPRKSGRRR